MTLARIKELTRACMETREPQPQITPSEYLTLCLCTEKWLRLAAQMKDQMGELEETKPR